MKDRITWVPSLLTGELIPKKHPFGIWMTRKMKKETTEDKHLSWKQHLTPALKIMKQISELSNHRSHPGPFFRIRLTG